MQTLALKLAQQWLGDNPEDNDLRVAIKIIDYLGERLFDDYEPSHDIPFKDRLNKWILNAETDDDKKILLKLISHVVFIGRKEFDALYKIALNREIFTWLIDMMGLKLDEDQFSARFKFGLNNTWFCPITDSMRINPFYHINGIESHDLRPHWKSLAEFGNTEKIIDYVATNKITHLVLLEDFIGSGTQCAKAIKFAASTLPEIKLLVVPLVVCPSGLKKLTDIAVQHANIKISPVITLHQNSFIAETAVAGEEPLFPYFRQIIINTADRVPLSEKEAPFGNAFGFRKMGALVVMYSNCPNNSIRILHYNGQTWTGLFPRSGRA